MTLLTLVFTMNLWEFILLCFSFMVAGGWLSIVLHIERWLDDSDEDSDEEIAGDDYEQRRTGNYSRKQGVN